MNILVYYPNNKRTIPIEIPLAALVKKGHRIFALTTSETKGAFHEAFERIGAATFHYDYPKKNAFLYFIRNILFLRAFCKKHKIDVVFAHLQQANLLAVASQPFSKAHVIPFRHHCKFHSLVPGCGLRPHPNEIRADKIINSFARKLVVPSRAVKKAMVENEGVPASKVRVIPYVYDFQAMRSVDASEVERIKSNYVNKVVLIIVSRLVAYKRHAEAIETLAIVRRKGVDACLFIMDEGPEMENIKRLSAQKGLAENVHFWGFKRNVLEYIAASDILLNPSLTDASNSVVKEAGLLEKVVITCNGVGDCDDYIVHQKNGFLVDPGNFAQEAAETIHYLTERPDTCKQIGAALHKAVVSEFSLSDKVVEQYEMLLTDVDE